MATVTGGPGKTFHDACVVVAAYSEVDAEAAIVEYLERTYGTGCVRPDTARCFLTWGARRMCLREAHLHGGLIRHIWFDLSNVPKDGPKRPPSGSFRLF